MSSWNASQLTEQLRQWWQRGRIHLVGPAGSVVFHVVVVLILVNFAVTATVDKAPNVEVMVMTPTEPVKLDEIMKDVEPPREEPQEIPTATEPVDAPYAGPVVADAPVSDMPGSGDGADTGLGNLAGDGIGSGDATAPKGFEIGSAKSPLVFKGLYANRTRGGRGKALASFGGSAASEGVVVKALKWLKEHQNTDGSWPGSNPSAMTGLALLTYLAHGETPASPEYGATVRKAIEFMVANQNDKGEFAGRSVIGGGTIDAYAQAIATYSMAESYALTKIMPVKDAMEKGLQRCLDGQQKTGGFFYGYGQDRYDTSVAGWQAQAMKAAKMAGSTNPHLEEAIKRLADFFRKESFAADGSGFVYQGTPGAQAASGGNGYAMTAIGTLGLQMLGQGKCKEVRRGMELMETEVCKWPEIDKDFKEKGEGDGAPVYKWYYMTQAKFQNGGKAWEAWNKQFAREIMRNQLPDGHWEHGIYDWNYCGGSWVYTTTLCALTLQVYYRYLPTYQHVEDSPAEAAAGDDMQVKVL